MILKELLFLNSPHQWRTLIKIAWAVCVCRLPLGMPCRGMPDTIAQRCFLSQKVTGIIYSHCRKEFLVVKWLPKILNAQKAFLVSAHGLSFFLSCRHELGAWLNCTTFIIFFFLRSIAIGSKRKLNQTREKAAPQRGPWYERCRADVFYQTQQYNSWDSWPDILLNWEADVVLEHWYWDVLLWSILTLLGWRQKKRNAFLKYKASIFPSSPKSSPLALNRRDYFVYKRNSWGENLFVLLASLKPITKKV